MLHGGGEADNVVPVRRWTA